MRASLSSSKAIWSPHKIPRDSTPKRHEDSESSSPYLVRPFNSPIKTCHHQSEGIMSSSPNALRLQLKSLLPSSLRSSLSIHPAALSLTESPVKNHESCHQISPAPPIYKVDLNRSSFLVLKPAQIEIPSLFNPTQNETSQDLAKPSREEEEIEARNESLEDYWKKLGQVSPNKSFVLSGKAQRESLKKAEARIHKQVRKRKYVRRKRTRRGMRKPKKAKHYEEDNSLRMIESEFVQHRRIKIVPSSMQRENLFSWTHKKGTFMCKDCKAEFKTGQALGGHRSKMHNARCVLKASQEKNN